MPFADARNRFRPSALASVEGNPIEVVLDRRLVRIVRVSCRRRALGICVLRFRSGEHQILPVRTPHGIRLHVTRIVRARQMLHFARGPVVPHQYAARRIKDLQKPVILEIGDVIELLIVDPCGLIVVTTYFPSGETWDMKPSRTWAPSLPRKELHAITSSLRMAICGLMETSAYKPLSFCGPSRSSPSVLPSREKEWQFAHVCSPSSSPGCRFGDVAQPPGNQRDRGHAAA